MNKQFPSKGEIVRQWNVLDAENQVLGRVASKVAMMLMGKHKPTYTPFLDTGDHIVVINAEKIRLTGRKEEQKIYRHHTGYPGGLVEVGVRKVRSHRPARMLEEACRRTSSASKCIVSSRFTPAQSTLIRRSSR